MAVLGNRWSSAVVGAAFLGVRRFTDFQERLGIPPTVLARRLAALCRHGILARDGAAYRLTDKGLDFFPAIAILVDWAQRWEGSAQQRVLEWIHLECGAPLRGMLTCDQCGKILSGTDIELGEVRRDNGSDQR
jgi:DNA-binding HxlR family transcriptional regulator